MPDIKIPNQLVENIRDMLCVPWCGAGISIPSGLPTWGKLVQLLLRDCEDNGLNDKELQELNSLYISNLYEDVTDYCRDFLGEGLYTAFLNRVLNPSNASASTLHDRIVAIPSNVIVTNNYDRLFEEAMVKQTSKLPAVYTSQDTEVLWKRYAKRERFLLKVHGDIMRPNTVIFSSRDYTKHVFGNLAFIQFLQRLMVSSSILFLGTSLTDAYITRILEESTYVTGGVGMPHFALLPNTGAIRSRLLRDRYNITVISFDLGDFGSYDAAYDLFFGKLLDAI